MVAKNTVITLVLGLLYSSSTARAQEVQLFNQQLSTVGNGWAGNSVNTVIFRKNSLVSFGDYQFISYYDPEGFVVIGKRKTADLQWSLTRTKYKGNINDAHNSISLMIDGDGYLHLSWDQHVSRLRYCRSLAPLSTDLTDELPMTGKNELKVTYPEFYKLPDGNLIFLYRDGSSGNGNLVINKYITLKKEWIRLQDNLIDGESKRNAYWQGFVDIMGNIHLSWVWRESPDVASNHDLAYAVSRDGGISWEKSTGEVYQLPIRMGNAEKVCAIAQGQELINQTSMQADKMGRPVIAGYWKGRKGVPQYHIAYIDKKGWQVADLGFRATGFSLSGTGTKKIPISRPQVITWDNKNKRKIGVLFRDTERDNSVSIAVSQFGSRLKWKVLDLLKENTGAWEPTYDTELWKNENKLSLFVQQVQQADAETVIRAAPTSVQVLTLTFN